MEAATDLAIHNYDSAVAYLMGRINYERTVRIPYRSRDFKLQRMEQLLGLVGNPHFQLPAVHIAGTKGKGSTAVMIESILRSSGYRTGLYTSPHLERLEERFALDGLPCSEEDFVRAAQVAEAATTKLDQQADGRHGNGPTYFEVTTAIAMLIFANANVDIAVLEVGLGGRLDSTNVCRPLVSLITSISFDHTKQLGNTIASIAREKAGIIKPGVPVVSGACQDEAAAVIQDTALQHGSPLIEHNKDFGFRNTSSGEFGFWQATERGESVIENLRLAMPGRHQLANAAVASAAARLISSSGRTISDDAIRAGLANAACPARVEVIRQSPPIILDAAHNVASCEALVEALEEHFSEYRNRTLILATSSDKDVTGMIRVLAPAFDQIIFTRYLNNPRSANPIDLLARLNESFTIKATTTESPAEALKLATQELGNDRLLCIAGSFFLAAEIRPLLREMATETRSTARNLS